MVLVPGVLRVSIYRMAVGVVLLFPQLIAFSATPRSAMCTGPRE